MAQDVNEMLSFVLVHDPPLIHSSRYAQTGVDTELPCTFFQLHSQAAGKPGEEDPPALFRRVRWPAVFCTPVDPLVEALNFFSREGECSNIKSGIAVDNPRDRIIDNERTRQWIRGLPMADRHIREFPDAAHTLEFESDPREFIQSMADWIVERCAGPSRRPD